MEKNQIEFHYNGVNVSVQCRANEELKYIFQKFKSKVKDEENNKLIYLYNGISIQNEELTFNEIANLNDIKRNQMNILVTKNEIDSLKNIKDYTLKNH